MHLRVQDVSNFLAVGGLGSGSVRLSHYRGVDVHLRAEASISRFVFRHGVAAVPKTPIPRASAGPENTQLRTAQIVNSGPAIGISDSLLPRPCGLCPRGLRRL